MKIQSIFNSSNNIYKTNKLINSNKNNYAINHTPIKDTINFTGNKPGYEPSDLQIYRCISEAEYQFLLNGYEFYGKYATTNPKGWNAGSWQGGYRDTEALGPYYFITFKTDRIDILSQNDDIRSDRYSATRYTINDVANIRKGTCIHGELVYSEDFEKAKAQDIKEKEERISQLQGILATSKDAEERYQAYDELASFSQEFPSIVKNIVGFVDFQNEDELQEYLKIITESDSSECISEFNQTTNALIKLKAYIGTNAFIYAQKYGIYKSLREKMEQ